MKFYQQSNFTNVQVLYQQSSRKILKKEYNLSKFLQYKRSSSTLYNGIQLDIVENVYNLTAFGQVAKLASWTAVPSVYTIPPKAG